MYAIELTPELLVASACLVFWLGRMTKPVTAVGAHDDDGTGEYEDNITERAGKLYSDITFNEYDVREVDDYIKIQHHNAFIMACCLEMCKSESPLEISVVKSEIQSFINNLPEKHHVRRSGNGEDVETSEK